MRCIRIILGFVGVLGLSATAAADSAFYLGGGVGMYDLKIDSNNFGGAVLPPSGFDDSAGVWRVLAGYQLNKYIGFQGDYLWYGDTQQHTTQTNSRNLVVNGEGAEASVRLSLPLGEHFELYGRVGEQWYTVDAKLQNVKGESDNNNDLMVAAGLVLNFTPEFSVNTEYEAVDISSGDLYIWTVNAVYKFHH